MSAPRIETHPSSTSLAVAVAGDLLRVLEDAQKAGRVPHVVLTGGTIADVVHRELARLAPASTVDWQQVHLWWGDERFVAPDSPDRNAAAARAAFITPLGLPAEHVHEAPSTAQDGDVTAAAEAYAAEMLTCAPELFDVVMLGVGPDAHVASLFPGRPELHEAARLVVPVTDSPKPPPQRVSLTLPALRRTRAAWFLVSGEAKAEAVARALSPKDTTLEETPASGVRGHEETVWFLDREAASGL